MSNPFLPWQFQSPYIPATIIRAQLVNPNFNGISVSFRYVAEELNKYRPRLPENFTGNNFIPQMPYNNTLLGINAEGNMTLFNVESFKLASANELSIVKTAAATVNISGDSHGQWIVFEQSALAEHNVVVGMAVADVAGSPTERAGTCVIITQLSDKPVNILAAPGVTLKSAGLLNRPFAQNSTITLMALDVSTWVLGGDLAIEGADLG